MFYTDNDLKVKDLKVDGKGIFYYINEIKPLPFINLIEPKILDMGFDVLHGEKILSPFAKDKFIIGDKDIVMNDLATMIISMFGSKWESMISLYETELDLETYKLETTESLVETGSRTNTRTDVNENERLKLISTFDDETLSIDEKEVNTGNLNTNDTGSTNNDKNITRVTKGNINNKLSDVNRYLRILQTTVLNDIIYADVSQLLGLSIY